MQTYNVVGVGGSPKAVFSRLQEEGKIPPHITDIQLVALPHGIESGRYIDAIKDQFSGSTAGAFILYLGEDTIKIPREEMTGKCSNNEQVFKGQRKWITTYAVYYDEVKTYQDEYSHDIKITNPVEISTHETKGDAVTAAKEYAIQNDIKTYIRLEKRLDASSGVQLVAEYEPQKKTVYDEKKVPQNRYQFFGQYVQEAQGTA